ncbi:MAG: hypothetical protein H7243_05665 [Sphingomonadaceae bacterium]|nr:hypothetical protein [Sphingomonadaceae bacterium]
MAHLLANAKQADRSSFRGFSSAHLEKSGGLRYTGITAVEVFNLHLLSPGAVTSGLKLYQGPGTVMPSPLTGYFRLSSMSFTISPRIATTSIATPSTRVTAVSFSNHITSFCRELRREEE